LTHDSIPGVFERTLSCQSEKDLQIDEKKSKSSELEFFGLGMRTMEKHEESPELESGHIRGVFPSTPPFLA
jgi:hypothetical protein